MIDIHIKLTIDTNDPREAYLQAKGALAFSGHEHTMSDYWLINGKPLPKQVAQNVKRCNGARKVTKVCNSDVSPPERRAIQRGEEILPAPGPVTDWRDTLRTHLRGIEDLPELRIDHPEGAQYPSVEAMDAFNSLVLENIFAPMLGGFVAEHNREMMGERVDSLVEPLDVRGYDLPERECIHNEVDFDVGPPDYTPMFRNLLTHQGVDQYIRSDGPTPIDFDVGTAEGEPLSPIDVEIHDLLSGLRQAE